MPVGEREFSGVEVVEGDCELIVLPHWDEVVLSKTVLSNFCPKQVNKWIGGPQASLFLLFIAFLT
jgi:hypothetical protein